jgi:hypothetical protein
MTLCTTAFDGFVTLQTRLAMRGTYDVTLTCVRVTIVAMEKQ